MIFPRMSRSRDGAFCLSLSSGFLPGNGPVAFAILIPFHVLTMI